MTAQEFNEGQQRGFGAAGSSMEETSEAGEATRGEMKEKAETKKEDWKAVAGHKKEEWSEKFEEKAKTAVSEQTSKAANELKTTAEVLRQASENFREKDKSLLARYTEKAAERTEHLSKYLHEKNVDEFIEDAEEFVRRRPLVAIGGAFFAGTILARFLKASSKKTE